MNRFQLLKQGSRMFNTLSVYTVCFWVEGGNRYEIVEACTITSIYSIYIYYNCKSPGLLVWVEQSSFHI